MRQCQRKAECTAILRFLGVNGPGLERALTPGKNERLEFLGDAVLGLIVAEDLYRRRRDWTEADLAQGREHVVSARTLAAAGRRAGLDQVIRGNPPDGGWPDAVVANIMEALVAAAYLHGGLNAARAFILGMLADELRQALTGKMNRHPKSLLLELAQRLWREQPTYRLLAVRGRPQPEYVVEVSAGPVRAQGTGLSKRAAEAAAAQAALASLNVMATQQAVHNGGETYETVRGTRADCLDQERRA